MTKTNPKDEVTEQVRQMIECEVPIASETDEAEALLCSLSFQSRIDRDRHVWIDTDLDGIGIDLEDRSVEDEGDNTVAHVRAGSIQEAVEIVKMWLSGTKLPDWNLVHAPLQIESLG